MMTMKDLRMILVGVPDEAVVTVDENGYVSIDSITVSNDYGYLKCDLHITKGFSVTNDHVLDVLYASMKR